MDVLYLGPRSGTCLDRANALRRLGANVEHLSLRELLPPSRWVDRWTWHVGGHWFGRWIDAALTKALQGRAFDLCHVDGGEWVTPAVIERLRQHARRVVNYNIDDPTGPRDGPRFEAYRQAAPHYDLLVVVREENLPELERLGARRVMRVFRSADEVKAALAELEAWLGGKGDLPASWPGLDALAPALPRKGRHGAILLPFRALLAAIEDAK